MATEKIHVPVPAGDNNPEIQYLRDHTIPADAPSPSPTERVTLADVQQAQREKFQRMAEPTVIDKRPNYDLQTCEGEPFKISSFTAQPIGDYIVVKRIAEAQGLIIEADIAQDKPVNCEVIAVSNYPSSFLSGAALKALEAGDKVLIRRYAGTEVKVNGQEYTLVIVFDVLLKL